MTASEPRAPAVTTQPYGGVLEIPELGMTRRWFEAGELPREYDLGIIELLRLAFNGGPMWFDLPVDPLEHFDWKVRNLPMGGEAVVTTEDATGRVFGCVFGIHRRWLLRGEIHVARDGVDLARHPELQGRGMTRILAAHRGHDWHPRVEFALGYAAHPVDRAASIRVGAFPVANAFEGLVRPLSLPDLVRRGAQRKSSGDEGSLTTAVAVAQRQPRRERLARVARLGLRFALSFLRRRPAPRHGAWTISDLETFDQRFAGFIEAASSQFEFIQERSLDYLNWRFRDRRAGPFIIRALQQDGEVLGYSAIRVLGEQVAISDLLALPGRTDVAEALIRDALGIARAHRAKVLRCRMPRHHVYRPSLARAGFVAVTPTAGELISARGLDEAKLEFLKDEHARVHVMLADSDEER